VEKVMHESLETQAILQRMEEVRCDVDEDVQEIVEGARDMGKWRYYVRTYPWICLGAALAVGYLIVPRRAVGMEPDAQKPDELAKPSRLLATPNSPPKGNARGILLAFVGNLVMRGVAAYVGQQAGKLFASETVKPPREDQP
jgi:hypothetical protein